ncbi:MAG: HupE/UreJ family protein [Bacteroidetes bacterium]|nr:MAG: HupE/UreJ family protein [Bacteroidota bacterium]
MAAYMTTTKFKLIFPSFCLLLVLIAPQLARAHSPNQSYIYLRIYDDGIDGRFEVTAKDLNRALQLDLPDRMNISDVEPHIATIQAYLDQRTDFKANGQNYRLSFTEVEILKLDEMEDFVKFNFTLPELSQIPDALQVRYEGFYDTDELHKGVLIQEYNWKAGIVDNEALISLIFDTNTREQSLDLTDASMWKGFWALTKLGVWHIWIGLDHILFIIALILPAVVRRRETLSDMSLVDQNVSSNYSHSWLPVAEFGPAFWYILTIVTCFTIAHSVTLALAALGVINLSSRVVESIIAISIALAALHNITPIFKGREWLIAAIFGLFHGFGFASVLGEKGLSGDYMVLSLLGFNVGVEMGQILIICLVFPLLYLLRKFNIYPKIITYGSVLLIFVSLYWFAERAFEIDLPLGRWLRMALG